jgi:hypothetical protein
MRFIDVFNGDADGLCALHQLRLAEPAESELVTGPKRRIELLAEVSAGAGDRLTVLDVSLDRNREALQRLLDRGARVRWFDHHYAGTIPAHPLLEAHIDTSPGTCTSMLVDRHLGGRFRGWAVAAAFGDGLPDAAHALADSLGLDAGRRETLRALGEDLNYNAYGETEADLFVPPAVLYREMRGFADPFRFKREAVLLRVLHDARYADMRAALAVPPHRVRGRGGIFVLPDAQWSRRVRGAFASHLAALHPDRAHAVLVPESDGAYDVSIRAPRASPTGAAALAREFATGGGREAAAGIDHLPAARLEQFIERFDAAFGGPGAIDPADRRTP